MNVYENSAFFIHWRREQIKKRSTKAVFSYERGVERKDKTSICVLITLKWDNYELHYSLIQQVSKNISHVSDLSSPLAHSHRGIEHF
jgi:hypothetical protein